MDNNSDGIFEKVNKRMKKNKRILILSIISIILTLTFLITYILYLPIYIDISNYTNTEKIEMNSGKFDGSHKDVEYVFDDELFDYTRKYYDNNGREIKNDGNVYEKDIGLIKMSPYNRVIDKLFDKKENINNHKITLTLPLNIETEIVQGEFSIFSFEYLIQLIIFIGFIIFLIISIILLAIYKKNKRIIDKK